MKKAGLDYEEELQVLLELDEELKDSYLIITMYVNINCTSNHS